MVVNYFAVFIAAVVGWLAGAAWYGALGKPWKEAQGGACPDGPDATGAMASGAMPMGPMIIAFVAQLVMAFMLAGLVAHIGPPDILRGIVSGVLVWFGFVITTLAVNNSFQKKSWKLTAIDGGHWLAVLVLQGIVIGAFG